MNLFGGGFPSGKSDLYSWVVHTDHSRQIKTPHKILTTSLHFSKGTGDPRSGPKELYTSLSYTHPKITNPTSEMKRGKVPLHSLKGTGGPRSRAQGVVVTTLLPELHSPQHHISHFINEEEK
jgi:hypothetical protein